VTFALVSAVLPGSAQIRNGSYAQTPADDPAPPLPNFLALNSVSGYYKPAGVPETPELIYVAPGTSNVSLWVSGGDHPGYSISLIAFGEGGVLGMVNRFTARRWQQIAITASGIRAIGLAGNPGYFLVDDLLTQKESRLNAAVAAIVQQSI